MKLKNKLKVKSRTRKVETVKLEHKHTPLVVDMLNELAVREERKTHDSARRLIEEICPIKLNYLSEYQEFIERFKCSQSQSAMAD